MAPRGRKPTPTHLKVVTGNPSRRPINEDEPEFELTAMRPPAELGQDACIEWGRLFDTVAGSGVLTDADRAAFTAYCHWWGEWLENRRIEQEVAKKDQLFKGKFIKAPGGQLIPAPWMTAQRQALEMVRKFAGELGLTPSSRSRVSKEAGAGRGARRNSKAAKYGI
jgi:P27 family predicted phage terminase small subunit